MKPGFLLSFVTTIVSDYFQCKKPCFSYTFFYKKFIIERNVYMFITEKRKIQGKNLKSSVLMTG